MKNYFSFSRGQKIGVVGIAVIIIVQIIILNKGNAVGVPDPFDVEPSQYAMIEKSKQNKYTNTDEPFIQSSQYVLVKFNPNKYKEVDWEKIGFSKKQAKSIVKYKNRINGFKAKEDLKKVYVISDEKYAEIEPYIIITNSNKPSSKITDKNSQNQNDSKIESIELNSATVQSLTNVKGIGDYTAKGIIKYKKLLGGYHSVEQIKEVYGVSEENYEFIKSYLRVDDSEITLINVNVLSISKLKAHPYISWSIANEIIQKRFTGKLSSLQFLVDSKSKTQKELDLLLPYVEF